MKNYKIIILLIAIILLTSSIRLYLAYYLPIIGDGGILALGIEDMANGNFPSYINNPLFFITLNANVLSILNHYKFIPALIGILTTLIVYIYVYELFKSKILGLIMSLFASLNTYHLLFSSVLFAETTLVFFIFLILYSHLKSIKFKTKNWYILTGIFFGVSISIKQIAYFLPFILILQDFILSYNKKNKWLASYISRLGVVLFVGLIVSLPFLIMFYVKSGTFLEPNNPFLTTKQINNESYNLLYNQSNYAFQHLNPYLDVRSIVNFYNPSLYYYSRGHFNEIIFISFTLLGILILISKKPILFIYLMVFFLFFHLVLTQIQTQKYFIQSKILFLLFMSSFLIYFNKGTFKWGKFITFGFILIIVSESFILFAQGIEDTKSWTNTSCWNPSNYPFSEALRAYEWIKNNSNENDVIADPCKNEAAYYTRREITWINPFEKPDFYRGIIENNITLLREASKEKNIKFIIVYKNLVTTSQPNTPQFIMEKDYKFIKKNLNLSFSSGGIELYQTK